MDAAPVEPISRFHDDVHLVAALRAGDAEAFAVLVDRHHAAMVRVARAYVGSADSAEDAVQDAWLGVIRGIERFEGRSSLTTWLYRIVIHRSISRGTREARVIPFSTMGPAEPAVHADRFEHSGPDAGWWRSHDEVPDLTADEILSRESRTMIDRLIAALPSNQRLVITLRDVLGLSATETCEILGVTEGNQRVLLHRARSRVREDLVGYLAS